MHALGRIPDKFDPRDHAFLPKLVSPTAIPKKIDFRKTKPLPIKDQGQLGACTGFGSTRAHRRMLSHLGLADFDASELFAYYNGRSYEHTISQDSGCQIRDVVKQQSKLGYAPEADWPYVVSKFKAKPPAKAFAEAQKRPLTKYSRVDNTSWDAVRAAIAANGNLIIGISVFASFESDAAAKTGVIPLPQASEQELGGHCMDADGYDGDTLIVANSWSTAWGDKGFCYLPRAYVTNPKLCSDCWTLSA